MYWSSILVSTPSTGRYSESWPYDDTTGHQLLLTPSMTPQAMMMMATMAMTTSNMWQSWAPTLSCPGCQPANPLRRRPTEGSQRLLLFRKWQADQNLPERHSVTLKYDTRWHSNKSKRGLIASSILKRNTPTVSQFVHMSRRRANQRILSPV